MNHDPAKFRHLSHPEKRIYLIQALEPESSIWNISYSIKLDKPLNADLLRQAAQQVIADNDGLRLRFRIHETQIVQYLTEPAPPPVTLHDFSTQGGEPAFDLWAKNEAGKAIWGYDADLFRIHGARLSADKSALLLTIHHIVADGTGAALFQGRLTKCYLDLLEGRPQQTEKEQPQQTEKAAPISCLSFLDAEKAYLDSADCATDRAYWLAQFETLPERIELFPHVDGESMVTNRKKYVFPADLAEKIYTACVQMRTSPFRLILAAQYVYWARVSRNWDLIIGMPTANRTAAEFNDVVGMFCSTIPLRMNHNPTLSFGELVSAVSRQLKETVQHQRYPFDLLLNDLREKHGETQQLIDIMLAQYIRGDDPRTVAVEVLCQRNTLEPLTTYLTAGAAGQTNLPIELATDYQINVFTEAEIDAFQKRLAKIIESGLADPTRPLCHLEMLTEDERHTVIYKFNNTAVDYPHNMSLIDLFEAQVERTPHQVALIYRQQQLTYHQLHLQATQLAAMLRDRGVQRDSVVGLLVDRSISMIVGALGILKAGAAYAPIDPAYPEDRVQYMLDDSGATVLVTQGHFLNKFKVSQEIINLDRPDIFAGPVEPLVSISRPEDLAIIIYTSGSTGRPKGVMLEQRSLVNFSANFCRMRQLSSSDVIAKHASFSFDGSILEIFPTLMAGATLVIIPDDIRLDLVALNDYYQKMGVTGAFFTTQLGEMFNSMIDNQSLRFLDMGGEKLRSFTPRSYQLWNIYGPTECTVCTNWFLVDRKYRNIPIGKPIGNYRIYILDAFNNPQPVGAPGELVVAGVALARGYMNLPEKTAEAFVDNPLIPGERIYRTGDLARWLPDGNIEHLGRIDRQIKMRGFRIEPGEIEQALLKIEGVTESAVIDFKDPNDRVALCACLVGRAGLDFAAVRKQLSTMVPEYMVPQYFVQTDKFPLTGSGKIDRKALPKPRIVARETGEQTVAPRNDLERNLATIWQEALKLDQISIDGDFFALGGHSLKAVGLLARMEKELGVNISIKDFFRSPTIRSVAEAVVPTGQSRHVARIEPAPVADWYPVTSAQRQLYILSRLEGIGTTYNVPFRLEINGKLDPSRLSQTLLELVRRHESLRTSFKIVNGEPVQMISTEAKPRLRFLEALEDALPEIQQNFVKPFDLSKAPLFRAMLVQVAPNRHILLLDVHHIVFDGLSMRFMIEEVGRLYRGDPLPEANLQFKDYVLWHEKQQQLPETLEQGEFWREAFTDPVLLDMPTDFVRPPTTTFEGENFDVMVEQDLYRDLQHLGRKTGTTMHVVLLAALHALLGRYADQEDVITGTSIGARGHDDAAGMIGMFVNTVPLRSRPIREKTFARLVAEIKQTMIDYLHNQDYPLEKLYETVNLRRGMGRHPLFDITFVSHNLEIGTFHAEGLEAGLSPLTTGTAKFDICLAATESNENLRFNFEFRTSLFTSTTMNRFARHFLNFLRVVAGNPDITLGEIEFLGLDEKHQLLVDLQPKPESMPDSWYKTVIANAQHQAQGFLQEEALLAKYVPWPDHATGSLAAQSAQSAQSAQTAQPAQPIQPAQAVQSAQTLQPAQSAQSAQLARVYVLDRQSRLLPIGIPGEICLGGLGIGATHDIAKDLSQHDSRQKSGKLVVDPFVPGSFLYHTGDLGRRTSDGNLELLGRVDFQLKIKGYRIETARIEQRLLTAPGVRQAAVVAKIDANGNKYLCAYYEANEDLPTTTWKTVFDDDFPEYMRPGCFVGLRQMPRNDNTGEIDRAALPDPATGTTPGSGAGTATDAAITAAMTATERMIADVWAKVLKQPVGLRQNFFACGGDSLRAIALTAELQKNFEIRISDVFSWPTIAEQAANFRELKDNLSLKLGKVKKMAQAQKAMTDALEQNAEYKKMLDEYNDGGKAMAERLSLRTREYRTVMLTGATGYLGVYLLRELLQRRQCRLVLPVRGTSAAHAEERLIASVTHAFGRELYDCHIDRIEVIPADLTKERLGIEPQLFDDLAGRVDCVLHSAANVRHYGPYEEFYRSNVQATVNLLEFCLADRKKDFHNVSTMSVASGPVDEREWLLFTENDTDMGQKPDNVYVRTKLEAELKILEYRQRGLNICNYRAGNIAYDSVSGRFQQNIEENAFFHQVKSYALLGAVHDQLDERDISFVDQCAAALVTLFDNADLINENFHLSNPHLTRLSQFLSAPELGLQVETRPFAQFIDYLLEHYDHDGFHQPIETLLVHMGWLDYAAAGPETRCLLQTGRTVQILGKLGFNWKTPAPSGIRSMLLKALSERIEFLTQRVPVFAALNRDEIEQLAFSSRLIRLTAGQAIVEELQEPDRVFLVVAGHLEVARQSLEGWLGTVRLLGPGDLVGKDALMHGLPSPVQIEALEECLLLAFDLSVLSTLLDRSPRFALGLAKTFSRQVNLLESLFVNLN